MEGALAIVAGGFLLGLAGSLHCAAMCGGIASGALFLLKPQTARERMTALLVLQAGRITTYALSGGVLAAFAALALDPRTAGLGYRGFQWAGAVVLMWVGLTTAGLLPRVALPTGGLASLAAGADRLLAPLRRHPTLGPYALGLSWGLAPCPMVYAALFSAALTGSFAGGAMMMSAFGVGTLPGVLGAALGTSYLARVRGGPGLERTAGILIAAFGFSTLYFGWPLLGALCLSP